MENNNSSEKIEVQTLLGERDEDMIYFIRELFPKEEDPNYKIKKELINQLQENWRGINNELNTIRDLAGMIHENITDIVYRVNEIDNNLNVSKIFNSNEGISNICHLNTLPFKEVKNLSTDLDSVLIKYRYNVESFEKIIKILSLFSKDDIQENINNEY